MSLGIAVFGCGFWANEMHLPAFRKIPGVEVVGVASRTKASAQRTAARFGIERWTTDYHELLHDPKVHVVDILTPNNLHAPMAIAAAEQGKHIICIKPMALNLEEADRMIDHARRAGVRLFYAENVPFIPALRRAPLITWRTGGALPAFLVRGLARFSGPRKSRPTASMALTSPCLRRRAGCPRNESVVTCTARPCVPLEPT